MMTNHAKETPGQWRCVQDTLHMGHCSVEAKDAPGQWHCLYGIDHHDRCSFDAKHAAPNDPVAYPGGHVADCLTIGEDGHYHHQWQPCTNMPTGTHVEEADSTFATSAWHMEPLPWYKDSDAAYAAIQWAFVLVVLVIALIAFGTAFCALMQWVQNDAEGCDDEAEEEADQ